jgi:hypothetical protein
MNHWFRVMTGLAGVTASTILLSGCLSSPTYGTHKTAGEHLVDDVSNALNILPDTKNDQIAYQPRPGLVVPKSTDKLAPPQQSLKTTPTGWKAPSRRASV